MEPPFFAREIGAHTPVSLMQKPASRSVSLLSALTGVFLAAFALSLPTPARAQFTVTGENSMNYGGSETNHLGASYIGNYGTGTATLAGGATRNIEGTFFLGIDAASNGTMNITGAGTVWTFAGTRKTAYIGYAGTGALNITNSGRMNFAGALAFGTYVTDTSLATLTIASGGILATTASVTTSGISLGKFAGTNTASISVTGAGSLLSVTGGIQFDANTSLTVTDGGQATFTKKIQLLGSAATTTTAFVRVSGAGSLVSTTAGLDAGQGSTGIGDLTVTDGGKLRVGGDLNVTRSTIKIGEGAAPGYLDTATIYGLSGTPTIEFNHTSNAYNFTNDAGTGIALHGYLGVKILAGTTIFTANSSYTGGTTITTGTLKILNEPSAAGASGIGTGFITIGAAGTLLIGNGGTSGTVSSPSVITNNGQLIINRSDAVDLSGVISGSGPITKLGAGDLTLTGNNASYTGTLTFSGSTLTINHANALGSAASTTLLAPGAALKITTSGTIPAPITLSGSGPDGTGALIGAATAPILSGALTLAGNTTINVGGNLTITGAIGESATSSGLTKLGSGTLILAGTNTYTGDTTISAGLVNVRQSGALGAGTGVVTVASGTALQLQGNATITGHDLTLNGVGYLAATGALRNLAGNNTWGGNVTLASDSNLQIETGSTLTITGGLNGGNRELTKNGSGTLVLGGAGTFLGNVTINAGALIVDHSLALQSANVTLNSNPLTFGNVTAATFGGLTGNSPISLTNASAGAVTLTIDTAVNSTFYSVLSGSGSLVKTGTGTFTLYGTNTFTGSTLISGGTLRLNTALALQYSPVALAGTGSLTFSTNSVTLAGLSGGGSVSLSSPSAVTLTVNTAATSSYDGVISGLGSFIKDGTGNLTLAGANTFTGNTSITGGTLTLGHSLALQSSLFTATGAGTLSFGELTAATFGGLTGSRAVTLTNAASTPAGVALTINTAVTNSYTGIFSGLGSLTKEGTGTLSLGGANSYAGTTTVNAGTLNVSSTTALGTTAAGTTVASGATLEIAGLNIGAESLTLSGSGVGGAGALTTLNYSTVGGPVTLAGDTALGGNGGLIVTGAIGETGGARALTKVGNMTLTLSGTNTYTGVTNINNGRLTVTSANGLGTTVGGTVVASGASLEIAGVNVGNEAVTLSGTGFTNDGALITSGANGSLAGSVTLAGNSTITGGSGNFTLSGIIGESGGSHGLTKSGYSLLTLSGANTYTGVTTINAGTLAVSHANALGSTSGGTVVNAGGTLLIDGIALGAEALTFNSGVLLGQGTASASGAITLAGNTYLYTATASDSLTLTGSIGGTGGSQSLTKIGAGTLTLSGTNTYSGNTTIDVGTLQLGSAAALSPTTSLVINAGGTFSANGFTPTINFLSGTGVLDVGSGGVNYRPAAGSAFDGFVVGSGAFTISGGGSVNFTATSPDFAGSVSITNSSVSFNGTFGGSSLTVGSGGVLGGSGSISAPTTLGSGSHLAPGNSPGTLTFTNGLTLNSGAVFDFQLGTSSDLIRLTNGLLAGPTSGTLTLNLSNSGGFQAGVYTLIDFTGATTSNLGLDDFTLGTVIPGFNYTLALTSTGLTLTAAVASAIPEPSTYAALFGGAALGLAVWRRRRSLSAEGKIGSA
jgi:autotransporter-associated beta strand protein/T5SS/PEP-CTERM-associated repeat protein